MIRILLKDQLYANLQEVFSSTDDYVRYVLSIENVRSTSRYAHIKFNSGEKMKLFNLCVVKKLSANASIVQRP